MSLVGFQTALGRSVTSPRDGAALEGASDASGYPELSPDERARLRFVRASAGFRFTAAIQRSWCEGRAAATARQTLSFLSAEERQRLLAEWVDRGGGTNSFIASEAEGFLEFIAGRLPDPSHVRTLCRLEQATYRVSLEATTFEPPRPAVLGGADSVLCVGAGAALVAFYVEPDDLVAALRRAEPIPPSAVPTCHLLFAPGIPGLFRRASNEEVQLWTRLSPPVQFRELASAKQSHDLIESLVAVGAITIADGMRSRFPMDAHR